MSLETTGGVMSKPIERSTAIPTEKSQTSTTSAVNQPGVPIPVYMPPLGSVANGAAWAGQQVYEAMIEAGETQAIALSLSATEAGIFAYSQTIKAGGTPAEAQAASDEAGSQAAVRPAMELAAKLGLTGIEVQQLMSSAGIDSSQVEFDGLKSR